MEDNQYYQIYQKQQLVDYINTEYQYREYNQKVETIQLIQNQSMFQQKMDQSSNNRNIGKYHGNSDNVDGIIDQLLYQLQME